ncbi:hypothetical protein SAMD00019534_033110 [Acytostelium subglobosum LB1]|uniref:hypothetical protein n=1 Tax=Acytostelium subglobosum LB1 TaxID=1410327 RepID=UPI00064511E1|nr:hypothetical protein SAMD00019534_033110 [Acytostelium subglobosum LB1]GAM20136.1 hypothetical protein SAMD00019534_033110 [Acytostelium subglobosum LB1]|eukprot:XP_012756898.1 hypothetical protein SAMD00019534_033110 [Acytostelium subglobosum LB1]
MATSYVKMNESSDAVTERFRQLHELLVIEEHRIKSPIIDQMRCTMDSISTMNQEVTRITTVITSSQEQSPNHVNNIDNSDEMDEDQLIKSINSSSTIDQFIQPNVESINISNDGQLLNAVQHCERLASAPTQTSGLEKPRIVHIDNSVNKVIKMNITACVRIIGAVEFNNHYFAICENVCTMTHPEKEIDIVIEGYKAREGTPTSAVYARDNVYLFGGKDASNSYSRFNLPEREWYQNTPFTEGTAGGNYLSACFDGHRYIYLVGGFSNDQFTDHIDRFDIYTQKFSPVSSLPAKVIASVVFFLDSKLYIVGGLYARDAQHQAIQVFDLATGQLSTHCDALEISEYLSSCFDGTDLVYVLSKSAFIRVSLATKEQTRLAQPSKGGRHRLFYDNGRILLLLGKGHNMEYNKDSDNWTNLDDKYCSLDVRALRAMCIIRD